MKTVELILQKIKREGAVTAKQLSTDLNITTMGARQHLLSMENDGVLAFSDIKAKVGRPTRHWSLTAKGHAQFSDRHGELTVQFIDAVEELFGTEGVEKVTKQREEKTLENYSKALSHCTSLSNKLEIITQLREQEGYMAELVSNEDSYLLIENHCPICQAATRCPSLCNSELSIFQALLKGDAEISRKEHIVQGERRCVYHITPITH